MEKKNRQEMTVSRMKHGYTKDKIVSVMTRKFRQIWKNEGLSGERKSGIVKPIFQKGDSGE